MVEIRVAEERRPERCLYCHDSLGSAFFTCESCGATYHRECTTRCVNLGCRGAVHLDPGERAEQERAMWSVTAVIAVALLVPIVAAIVASRVFPAGDSESIGYSILFSFVGVLFVASIFVSVVPRREREGRTRTTPRETPRTRVSIPPKVEPTPAPAPDVHAAPTPVEPPPPRPEPAPGELQMPGLFAAHPIAMDQGKTSEADVERARHQREARNDRLRPPGLGKTI